MLYQLIALVGAAMVLAAYVALQQGRLAQNDRSFNLLNFAGSALLTWIAVLDRRWGFILLEGAWALLSLWGLARARAPARPPS
ncbi:MAG: hypothetical protein WKG32_22735 [Gemmatimonadaceae bacterium]